MSRVFSIIGGNDIAIKPDEKAIDLFWDEANAALPDLRADHQVRWIGLDEETTLEIIAYIRSGEKSATYTVPWINANYGWPDGSPGLPIILLGFDGLPAIMVETTDVIKINFGDIGSDLSGLDGPPVRDITVWRNLHTMYWNEILGRFGRECSPDMPVLVEKFKPVFPL